MTERIACAVECDFGIWPKSVMIASVLRTDELSSPTDLAFRVKTAVGAWLQNTAEGRAAFEASSQAFHAGHLLPYLGEPSLVARLSDSGIHDFELSPPVQFVDWDYDEPLCQDNISAPDWD